MADRKSLIPYAVLGLSDLLMLIVYLFQYTLILFFSIIIT
jgi:hypothetical protein